MDGHCDGRFEAVREAFAENFAKHGEVGAAVCVSVDGTIVVDLWNGPGWQRDTLVNVYSIGKGFTAVCAARLVGEGLLDVDAPVSRHWPEFGKPEITVRHVLSHQAGLPAVRKPLPLGAQLEWDTMTGALAEQDPWWEPGTAHGYHVNTFGFLVGEVVRRITGRSIGTMLRDEIAAPLGADVHIGLPESEDVRVAPILQRGTPSARSVERDLMRFNTYANPAGLSGAGVVNTRAWRAAEIPSTNAHATARGVARVYAELASGGGAIVSRDALSQATVEQVYGQDLILDRPSRFGLGFQLTQKERPLGPNDGAYGHFGAGGSLGFCDPQAGVAFGYVMDQMGPRWQNPRNRGLIDAVYASLR